MVLWGSGVNGDWVLWGVEWTRDWSLHWCLTPHMMTHIYSHPVFFLSEIQRLSELDDLYAYLPVKTLLMKIVCFHLYVHYTCRQMQRMQVHSYHFVIWCKSAECRCAPRCPTSLGCHGSHGNWSTACLPADLRTDGVQLLMCCGIYYLFIKGWSLKEEKHEVVQSRRLSHASYSRLTSGKTAVPATI